MNIGIIGTGKIGTHLAEKIIATSLVPQLYLTNRSSKRLDGTLQSLNIWKTAIESKTEILIMDRSLVSSIDLIIIAIKDTYDPREIAKSNSIPDWLPQNLRYAGVEKDMYLISDLCVQLREYRGTVAVITNPVDLMTTYISSKLKFAQVVGLGMSVDSIRFTFLLNSIHKIKVDPNLLLFAGEHGQELIALESIWKILNIKEKLDSKLINNLFSEVRKLGFSIVENLGYTLQDCSYAFFNDIKWLFNKFDSYYKIRTFSYKLNKVALGYPIQKENNKILPLNLTSLSDEEIIKLKYVENHLEPICSKLMGRF